MKSFNPSFFAVENFLQCKETFDCLPEQAGSVKYFSQNGLQALI